LVVERGTEVGGKRNECRLVLPIIGQFIWYIRLQNAVIEFWQATDGTTDPGLT